MKRSIRQKSQAYSRLATGRRGAALVMATGLLLLTFAFAALSIDLGYILMIKGELQTGADAAALAGVVVLGDGQGQAQQAATELAEINSPGQGAVLKQSDITFGNWDSESSVFTADNTDPNAIRVVLRRSNSNNNPVPLFFAPVLGKDYSEVSATAIAIAIAPRTVIRFLFDEETFDSDESSIENLASNLGVPPDDVISDGDGDGFIDIPGGTTLELPTGQQGDEGMFDTASFGNAFPFKPSSHYTALDFLAEGTALENLLNTQQLQDVEWTSSNAPHPDLVGKKVLDPVLGIDPMDSQADILSLPDPETIYLSPIFKSDVSMVESDSSKYGAPAANLQGERRGLVAYKILAARPSPIGGSYLPLLTIQIIDTSTIYLSKVALGGGGNGGSGGATLVQ